MLCWLGQCGMEETSWESLVSATLLWNCSAGMNVLNLQTISQLWPESNELLATSKGVLRTQVLGQRIPVPRGSSLLMICSLISPQILVQMASVQPSPAYNLSYDSGEGRSTSQLQPQCSPHLSSAAPSAELGCPAGAFNKKRWPHGQTLNPEKSWKIMKKHETSGKILRTSSNIYIFVWTLDWNLPSAILENMRFDMMFTMLCRVAENILNISPWPSSFCASMSRCAASALFPQPNW